MSFQFRFEKFLSMKEKEKESALNELHLYNQKKEQAERQLMEWIEKKDRYLKDYQNLLQQSLKVTDFQEREQYLDFLNKQIERLKGIVIEMTKEFNRKKKVLLAKNTEEKIWSSWRDKSLAEYTERTNREEQTMLDEMAVIRFYHTKMQQPEHL